jgi:inorganic pyrophosphatase
LSYHPWHDVELPRFIEDPIPAVIEIPTGSKVKYELDKRSGLLLVDRVLFSAVHYPANYGFVPRTYCDDGDPLDILVLCQEPIQPLAIMRAKLIGVMKMRDDKGEDDKLIAVHADDPNYSDYSGISQLPPHRLRELQRFFQDYKALENKKVLVDAPQGRSAALQVLRDAIGLYDREKERLRGGAPADGVGRNAQGRRARTAAAARTARRRRH